VSYFNFLHRAWADHLYSSLDRPASRLALSGGRKQGATDLNRTRVIDIARTSLRAAESITVVESVIIRI